MMPPTLLMVGIGRQRRVLIPLPLFPLMPIAFIAWYVLTVARLAFSENENVSRRLLTARTVLYSYANLSGLKIDVRSSVGSGVYLWMI